jgi:hypothetical protein
MTANPSDCGLDGLNLHPMVEVFFKARRRCQTRANARSSLWSDAPGRRFRLPQILMSPQLEARIFQVFSLFLSIRLDLKWLRGYTPRHLNFSPFSARLLDPGTPIPPMVRLGEAAVPRRWSGTGVRIG